MEREDGSYLEGANMCSARNGSWLGNVVHCLQEKEKRRG